MVSTTHSMSFVGIVWNHIPTKPVVMMYLVQKKCNVGLSASLKNCNITFVFIKVSFILCFCKVYFLINTFFFPSNYKVLCHIMTFYSEEYMNLKTVKLAVVTF